MTTTSEGGGRPRDGGSLSRRAIDGAGSTGAAAVGQFVAQTVALAVLARLLDPADFGLVAAANVVISFTRLFADLALGASLIQRERVEDRHVRTAFTFSVASGAALAGAMWLAAPWLATAVLDAPATTPALQVLAATFVFSGAAATGEAMLSRRLRFRAIAGASLAVTAAFNGALAIALAYAGWGWWSIVLAAVARSVAIAIAMIWLSGHSLRPLISVEALRDLFSTGFGFSLSRAINYVATSGDTLLVGRILGLEALGLYDRAFRIATLPSVIYQRALSRVALATMASIQTERTRLAAGFRRAMALTALFGLPLTAGLAILGEEIIFALLGEDWDAAIPVFQVLVAATFLRLAYRVGQSTILACGRVYVYAAIQTVYAAGVVAGVVAAAPHGLTAVAWAVDGAIAVNFILLTWMALRIVGLRWIDLARICAPGLLNGAVVAALLAPTAHMLRGAELHPVLVMGGALAAAGAGLALLHARRRSLLLGADGLWLAEMAERRLRALAKASPDRGAPVFK